MASSLYIRLHTTVVPSSVVTMWGAEVGGEGRGRKGNGKSGEEVGGGAIKNSLVMQGV